MSIRVEKHANPSIKHSAVTVDVYHTATSFRINLSGTLEVLEIQGGVEVVCHAYGSNHWIEVYPFREPYQKYVGEGE